MSFRRLAEHQPASFAFSAENAAWCQEQMKKYPPGRQSSAVIPILWRGQEQEGWVTKPMIEEVGRMLGMPYVRVLEVATFYTMFNLHPVGEHLVQVCTTTPCWLRGSDEVVAACKKHIHPKQGIDFRRRQILLDRNGMPGCLRQRADDHHRQRPV